MEDDNIENKENISRKRYLSESAEAARGGTGSEGQPEIKKVKVVDIFLGSEETIDLTNVKEESFVDGMY